MSINYEIKTKKANEKNKNKKEKNNSDPEINERPKNPERTQSDFVNSSNPIPTTGIY